MHWPHAAWQGRASIDTIHLREISVITADEPMVEGPLVGDVDRDG